MALLGPTAAGKSSLALELAEAIDAEILSVDSMQVYRGMDIGTAKPTAAEQERVAHHMLDLVGPEEEFSVAQFRESARTALDSSAADTVIIVGGSGLHFRSVVDPMTFRPHDPEVRAEVESEGTESLVAELLAADPAAGSHVDLQNPRRIVRAVESIRLGGATPSEAANTPESRRYASYDADFDFTGIYLDRDDLDDRIRRRLAEMMEQGFLDEVASVGPRLGRTARQAVGYPQLLAAVSGVASVASCIAEAERATMALVKRQRTFFGRDPRLVALRADDPDIASRLIEVART